MKKRTVTSLICLLSLQITVSGQERVDTVNRSNFKHAIGFTAGEIIGTGLSYRFCPDRLGVQGTLGIEIDESTTQYSTAIAFFYKIIKAGKTNLFIYQGNNVKYVKLPPDLNLTTKVYVNIGVGLGVEVIILKRISLNVMGGYAYFGDFYEHPGFGESNSHFGLNGEMGLFYKF
jgi:ribosomal protein S4E